MNTDGLWDAHMHTAFSGDSKEPPEVMISAAKAMGLKGITITDHLDWDYEVEPGLFDLDLDRYFDGLLPLKDRYSDEDFTVRIGIELGLQPHLADRHRAVVKDYPFDFVIGSVHVVKGIDPYYDEFFFGRSVREALAEYLDCVAANIEAFSDFDALGHLDYIVRYAAKRYGYEASVISPDDAYFRDRIDGILKSIITYDIALEVNTGAFRNGLTVPNPSYDILKRYRALGGQKITLGADAHANEHIGIAFGEVRERLIGLKFGEYCVYKNRVPEMYTL